MPQVILLSKAEEELESQLEYLSRRSPQGVQNWASAYRSAVDRISNDPESCGFAPENEDHEQEIRQAIFKTRKGNAYRIIFTINKADVYVFSIRGLGQDFGNFQDIVLP